MCEQFSDVRAGAAVDGPPLMVGADPEEAVIHEEANQRACREIEDLAGVGRPDCGTHGHQVVLHEFAPEAESLGELADRE